MSTMSLSDRRARVGRRCGLRLFAVAGAALAVVIVRLLADKAAGIDRHQPAFGTGTPGELSAGFAAAVAVIAALLGWGLLAGLGRLRARGRRLWPTLWLLALLASLGGPLSGHGVSAGARIALVCMHLAAATVLIPILYLSGRAER